MTQRTSTKLKLLRGTARGDRQPKESAAERLATAPPPPAVLTPFAAQEWRELAPIAVELGVLTRADLRAFALLCETLATECELRALLKSKGLTIRGADGNAKAHPAVRMLETTRAQAHRLLADFGLTPRGRQSVNILPPAKKGRLAMLDQEFPNR